MDAGSAQWSLDNAIDLEVAGPGPLAAVCPVPPSVMPYHAQFPTLSLIQQFYSVLIVTILTCVDLIH